VVIPGRALYISERSWMRIALYISERSWMQIRPCLFTATDSARPLPPRRRVDLSRKGRGGSAWSPNSG